MGQAGSLRPIGNLPVSCCRNRPRTNRLAHLRPRSSPAPATRPSSRSTRRTSPTLVRAWTYHMSTPGAPAGGPPPRPPQVPPWAGDAVQRPRPWPRRPRSRRREEQRRSSPLVIDGVMYLTTGARGRVAALEPETAQGTLGPATSTDGAPATRGSGLLARATRQSPAVRLLRHLHRKAATRLNAKDRETGSRLRQRRHRRHEARRIERLGQLILRPVFSADRLQERPHHRRPRPGSPRRRAQPARHAPGTHTRASWLWTFHSVPRPGETGNRDLGRATSWKIIAPGTNVLGILFTLDAERGILYMPFGEAHQRTIGAATDPAPISIGTSLVAADALTGRLKWYFQGVHHDTWDYDLCAPRRSSSTSRRNGRKIPAGGAAHQDAAASTS